MSTKDLQQLKDEALQHGDTDMARIINAAMWHQHKDSLEALERYAIDLEKNGHHASFEPFDMSEIEQHSAECIICGTEPEQRTCEGCGLQLSILDCEHDLTQPKDIDYGDDGQTMTCQDCYEKRQKARTYDERFNGFSNLEQLDWAEYEALDSLIADQSKMAKETLNEMIELRFDGDPDFGGWRGVLADWRGGEA